MWWLTRGGGAGAVIQGVDDARGVHRDPHAEIDRGGIRGGRLGVQAGLHGAAGVLSTVAAVLQAAGHLR